jgi:hypothetical protein
LAVVLSVVFGALVLHGATVVGSGRMPEHEIFTLMLHGKNEQIKKLINKSPQVLMWQNRMGDSPLAMALKSRNSEELVALMLGCSAIGLCINKRNSQGKTALSSMAGRLSLLRAESADKSNMAAPKKDELRYKNLVISLVAARADVNMCPVEQQVVVKQVLHEAQETIQNVIKNSIIGGEIPALLISTYAI